MRLYVLVSLLGSLCVSAFQPPTYGAPGLWRGSRLQARPLFFTGGRDPEEPQHSTTSVIEKSKWPGNVSMQKPKISMPPEIVQAPRSGKKVTLRELRLDDLPELMTMVEREFISSADTLYDRFEAWSLRQNIYWGFRMRLNYPDPEDHKVFVLEQGSLAGMVEISKQPTTSIPPSLIPLPRFVKNLFHACGFYLRPYISNLLIDSRLRRRGYAELLIRRCEEYARSLGSNVIYLHADLDYRPAVRLYGKLGYETVRDDPALVKRLGMTQLRYFRKNLD